MILENSPNNNDIGKEEKIKQVSAKQKISSLFSVLTKGPSAFHLKFKDRIFAVNILAATIQDKIGSIKRKTIRIMLLFWAFRGEVQ